MSYLLALIAIAAIAYIYVNASVNLLAASLAAIF